MEVFPASANDAEDVAWTTLSRRFTDILRACFLFPFIVTCRGLTVAVVCHLLARDVRSASMLDDRRDRYPASTGRRCSPA